MAFADGELSATRTVEMQQHLEGCRECRMVVERFRAVRASLSKDELFPEVVRRHSTEVTPREVEWSAPRSGARRASPSVWAASVALMLTGALLWQLLTPAPVSARELIARARVEESRPLLHFHQPVLERRLRITRSVAGVMRERTEHEERWHGASGLLTRVQAEAPVSREIAAAIGVERCAALAPLSVDMMSCLAEERDMEIRVLAKARDADSAVYQLAIDHLSPSVDDRFHSVWTLRMADWRLIRVDYHFQQSLREVHYTVEEMHYRVVDEMPVARVAETLKREPGRAVASHREGLSAAARTEDAVSTMAQRKATLLLALHGVGLMPDDDVVFAAGPPDLLHVRVVVWDGLRKERFREALDGLEGVRYTVTTYQEEAAMAQVVAAAEEAEAGLTSAALPGTAMRSDGPLLFQSLTQQFGGGQIGQQQGLAVGAALMESMLALQFQASWLERSRDSLSPNEWARLSAMDQARLQTMDLELVEALQAGHRALVARVEALLCPPSCPDAPDDQRQPAPFASVDSPSGDGATESRDTATLLSARLQEEFGWLKVLFVDGAYLGTAVQADTEAERATAIQRTVANWRQSARFADEWVGAHPHADPQPLQWSQR